MKKLTMMRDADLVAAAKQALAAASSRGESLTVLALVRAALARQPRSHYIDFDTASKQLHRIERMGLEAAVRKPQARRKWAELQQQVAEAMATRRKLNFVQALTFVLHFRRPSSFCLGVNAAYRIIRPHIRLASVAVRS